jgi:hypothetical protein
MDTKTAAATSGAAAADAERVPVAQQDFLDQDPPVRGQRYVLLSFLSPESVLQEKAVYFLSAFLKGLASDVGVLLDSLKERFKDAPEVVDMVASLRERHDYLFDDAALKQERDAFVEQHLDRLEGEFAAAHQFRTSIRGIKVRGSYESLEEAKMRAELLKKRDTYCDTYIAEVGCWCPWDPSPNAVGEAVHAETDLNTIMKKYKENIDAGKTAYELRRQTLVDKSRAHAERERAKVEVVTVVEEVKEAAGAEAGAEDKVPAVAEDADPWLAAKQQAASKEEEAAAASASSAP